MPWLEIGEDFLVSGDPVADLLTMGAAAPLARRSAASVSPAVRTALAQRMAQRGAVVQQSAPTKKRQQPVGFPITAIAAAAQGTLTTNPQQLFKPERLIIPSSIAASLTVNQILIGRNNQILSATGVPGVTFTELVVGGGLSFDTCQVNMPISLIITNNSGAAINVSASMIGEVVE